MQQQYSNRALTRSSSSSIMPACALSTLLRCVGLLSSSSTSSAVENIISCHIGKQQTADSVGRPFTSSQSQFELLRAVTASYCVSQFCLFQVTSFLEILKRLKLHAWQSIAGDVYHASSTLKPGDLQSSKSYERAFQCAREPLPAGPYPFPHISPVELCLSPQPGCLRLLKCDILPHLSIIDIVLVVAIQG